ncbi:hypothetical protein C0389_08175 [bacterium]|nr:hypothetical protein [bacterium]
MTLTKTKSHVKIARSDWEKMKKNPALSETIELLEDISDMEKAKKNQDKCISLEQYLKKRGIWNSNQMDTIRLM